MKCPFIWRTGSIPRTNSRTLISLKDATNLLSTGKSKSTKRRWTASRIELYVWAPETKRRAYDSTVTEQSVRRALQARDNIGLCITELVHSRWRFVQKLKSCRSSRKHRTGLGGRFSGWSLPFPKCHLTPTLNRRTEKQWSPWPLELGNITRDSPFALRRPFETWRVWRRWFLTTLILSLLAFPIPIC